MKSIIRYADARCALGADLESAVTALLAAERPLITQSFPLLRDPVSQPYFAMVPQSEVEQRDIFSQLLDMTRKALEHCGLSDAQRARTGLFVGSSSFDVRVSEQTYYRELQSEQPQNATAMPIIGYGKLAGRLQRELGLGHQVYTYCTACTSSANAALYGHRMLQAGLIDHALVLGFEFFNHTSLLGFQGLNLISPSAAMRPFDQRRDGLILGEGCGLLLLSRAGEYPAALELCGGAIATDNHSLTAANNDGSSVVQVIRAALSNCNLSPEDIRAVKLHGTASLMNDEAEAGGLRQLFGDGIPDCFAIKPFCGHTLGACGALEMALVAGSLARNLLPGLPDHQADEQLGVTLPPAAIAAPPPGAHLLFNCFAFGGNNNALILRRVPQ